ncbi:glycine zipper 2TM domain-containing protein [Kineobactrum salinum]|uniref:Glycine zipper 2TM domain-containing protein n=2 Tax=Kineobactrum salinum TaxID=2708301 RepID=A0A6C0U7M7_9GAMM|nr:glycine zipper 2TM domain-containing protein [Kineobactrum salinum]QIB66455.1 glycine zipper 2TM domain-containing protein [Kineobactrum salinum]
MNKSMLSGIVLGVAIAAAGGVVASYNWLDVSGDHAQVLEVSEVRETVQTPREVCQNVQVTRQQPVKDEHRVLGTVAGAVVGGVLGNQVGDGSGKKVATVAGAAAGGYAGNKTQERIQAGSTYVTTERQCETVTDSREEVRGYDVKYRLDGEEGSVRMAYHPGDRIPVTDGQLVLEK